ncbi:FkbM family methyltransferase [Streptomyces europaeiscabiei]|uniref:FkbM family methyltransferase n=2 Tax=Streptomyces europaeiscabiei TaxID=146819 RepID=UPI0029AEE2D5|nr:FkbM family methyltransferase [Streptomyces europaeiscabiei]MDX2769043.1 FkbM family methyltransferase [Streptomyces europaeiscabiei]MDX3673306.1 FkbM family methyltransferase [Streptomyces europaeiscabiei]MDX3716019.1 FkbM family methyltransferase [Streptomyces europaeiscabiei]MDX3867709.1 FkbM family methyltransferase [Streptomyces europaeiscabiei]MDX3876279.1 FkbM family methyltransferase [Streptomyces europaeiscabiei]
MSPYTITAEEERAAATPAAAQHRWHLALAEAANGALLDAGLAALRTRAGGAVASAEPVGVVRVGGRTGGHRAAVLAGPDGAVELGLAQTADSGAAVAFMFPGLGDHYLDMGRDLYRDFPVFKTTVDRCAEALTAELGLDIRDVIFTAAGRPEPTATGNALAMDLRRMLGLDTREQSAEEQRLNATRMAQPALFVVEYALAALWESWGVRPTAMIGYSLGEYVAATLAGVLSLEDALVLVARRAALIDELPEGTMLAVMLPEEQVRPLTGGNISLSAVNGPEFCVVGGPVADIFELERTLADRGVITRRVTTTHAFHSSMMEPIADQVTDIARGLTLNPPRIPYISNVTGRPITDEQATDPAYWARHLLSPVRFADGLRHLGQERLLLESGPGQTLSSLATVVRGGDTGNIVASMRHSLEPHADTAVVLKALGRLWLADADAAWHGLPCGDLATTEEAPMAKTDATDADGAPEPTETETALRAVWARILKNEDLPRDVSFFELGGNSLLATRLMLRISRAFDIELTLRQVYEFATLTRMAAAIDILRVGGDPETAGEKAGSSHTGSCQARFRLPNGLTVHHQNESETRHFYEDIFDHRVYAKNGISLRSGDTVVDVGGNIGLFTLFAHYEAQNVRVFTFEPAPPLFELLSRNVAEHGVDAKLFNIGISDTEAEASFTFYPRSSGMSSFHPDEEEEKHNLRTIIANQRNTDAEARRLTDYAEELMDVRFEAIEYTARLRPLSAVIREQGIERIDLIKIDVQKSERQVIDGIADEDWPKIRQMVLEAHDADGEVERLAKLLEDRGFTVKAEQDELYVGTDIYNIFAVRGAR